MWGSYKLCSHPHSPKPSQRKFTVTCTRPKKGHTDLHPSTPSHVKVTPTHTKPKKGHAHPNSAVNVGKRKFFVVHQVIKFVRNSRSHQHPKINRHQYLKGRNFGQWKFFWNRFWRLISPKTANLAE